jgi:hypothetical protein
VNDKLFSGDHLTNDFSRIIAYAQEIGKTRVHEWRRYLFLMYLKSLTMKHKDLWEECKNSSAVQKPIKKFLAKISSEGYDENNVLIQFALTDIHSNVYVSHIPNEYELKQAVYTATVNQYLWRMMYEEIYGMLENDENNIIEIDD